MSTQQHTIAFEGKLSHTFLLNFLKGYSSSSTFRRPVTASFRTLVQCSSFRSGRPGGLNVIHFQSTCRQCKKVEWVDRALGKCSVLPDYSAVKVVPATIISVATL